MRLGEVHSFPRVARACDTQQGLGSSVQNTLTLTSFRPGARRSFRMRDGGRGQVHGSRIPVTQCGFYSSYWC